MINNLQYMAQSIGGNRVNLPTASFDATFPNIVSTVLGIAILLSVLFVVIGGFKYTTSNGSSEGIKKAKDTILYAIIGLVISLSAYVIVQFVLETIK